MSWPSNLEHINPSNQCPQVPPLHNSSGAVSLMEVTPSELRRISTLAASLATGIQLRLATHILFAPGLVEVTETA